jgi:aspartyl protease family protein
LKRVAGSLDKRGQCYVTGWVNGTPMSMLVDSGATTLLFSRNHLSHLAVDAAALHFDRKYGSANGVGRAAKFVVHQIQLGDFVLQDIPALISEVVNDPSDDAPLLGMSVLKFMRVELGGGACALLWQ